MPKKKVWTDEERAELAKKLDSELEEYVADCIAKQKEKNEKEGEKESDLNIEVCESTHCIVFFCAEILLNTTNMRFNRINNTF